MKLSRIDSLRGGFRNITEQFAYLPRALKLVWEAASGWTTAWFGLLIVRGLLPTASVYLVKVLVDRVDVAIGAGFSWESLQYVVLPAGLMALVLLLQQVLQGVLQWVQTGQSELVQDHLKEIIHERAARVDLEFYDTPSYFDHLERANGQAASRSLSLLQKLGGLIENCIRINMCFLRTDETYASQQLAQEQQIPGFAFQPDNNSFEIDSSGATQASKISGLYFDTGGTNPRLSDEQL